MGVARRVGALLLATLSVAALAGCRRRGVEQTGVARASLLADENSPLYPLTDGPPEPLAGRLCEALHALPEERRAACCGTTPAAGPAGDCARHLSSALRAGAVQLNPAEVEACVAAMQKLWAGCDTVGPLAPPTPAACLGLVHGRLRAGVRCRSSLDCADGLRCQAVGAEANGRCGPPFEIGAACGHGTDALAALARQEDLDEVHPECVGHCERHECAAPISAGAPCASSAQCDAQHHCARNRCQPGRFAKAGEPCIGGACAWGLRCVADTCIAVGAEGAPCESDLDCRGACRRTDAGSRGVCAVDCLRR